MKLRIVATAATAAFLVTGLAACGSTGKREPEVRVQTVKVEVVKPCVPAATPGRPKYPDSDEALRAAPGAADRYQLMAAGRIARDQRLNTLEPLVDACRMPAKQTDAGKR